MTSVPMRVAVRASTLRAGALQPQRASSPFIQHHAIVTAIRASRALAHTRDLDGDFSGVWFSSTPLCHSSLPRSEDGGNQPPDERTLKLGKTIRILHERLPTLLREPLPQEILSPQISLQLFPSTHPHLPTVTGRIPYIAALWTAPVAWNRVPVVGNIKLIILSERMVRNGGLSVPHGYRSERLVVRWKTCGKTKGKGVGANYQGLSATEAKTGAVDKITQFLGGGPGEADDKEFQGLFLFEFDEEGRVAKHVIEHVDEGGNWEKMPMVVNVTDWLLGRGWRKQEEGFPQVAMLQACEWEGRRRRVAREVTRDKN